MTVISELSRLESAGLIRLVQYEPELEYLFRHALVQDAAYGTLLRTDRKRLHHAVGEAVEALYANRLDELAPMLARHFQQSGDEERALAYYVRAGDCALASFANEEAESLLRSALALSCSQPQRALLLGSLGEALFRQSRLQEAMETWQQGIDTYRQLDDTAAERQTLETYKGISPAGFPALLRLMQLQADAGDWVQVLQTARKALEVNPLDAAPHQRLVDARDG